MSTENLAKFTSALQDDAALQASVKAIHASTDQEAASQLAAIAREAGIPLTTEEILAADRSGTLDLDELDSVVGGFVSYYHPGPEPSGSHEKAYGARCLDRATGHTFQLQRRPENHESSSPSYRNPPQPSHTLDSIRRTPCRFPKPMADIPE